VRRAALAAAVLLSGSRTMAEPCAPAARLDGDGDVAAKVAVELQRLGVAITAGAADAAAPPGSVTRGEAGCPSLRAAVARDPSGAVAVTIRDGADRIEGRVVGDAQTAAIWIDSWLRDDDVDAPLLAPRIVPAAVPAPPASPSETPAVATAAAAPATPDRLAFDAAYESRWADDGTGWTGASASACWRIGPACAGARVRAAWLPQTVTSDALSAYARSDLAAYAIATTSIELGRMRVAPELGFGVGRMSTRRFDSCKPPPMCDPTTDPNCGPNGAPPPGTCTDPATMYTPASFEAETWTPRAAASVRVAVPLFDHVWLEGTASAELAAGAHGPFATQPDAAGNVITTPGEPQADVTLGVGVRVGAP
jgi:hypothetical protein